MKYYISSCTSCMDASFALQHPTEQKHKIRHIPLQNGGLLENTIFADRTFGYGVIKHNPNKQPLDPLTTTSEMDFSDGADQLNRLYSTKCKFLIDPSVSQEAHQLCSL